MSSSQWQADQSHEAHKEFARAKEGEDYKALYEIALAIMLECAGPRHTPIIGWDRYCREELARKRSK